MRPSDRELMQQALEALEFHVKNADEIEEIDLALVTALRERLAQPEQEPYVHAISKRTADELWLETDRLRSELADLKVQQQEPVAWGVDWGKAGDQSCVSIIKRLPDGGIEVLATEYGPPASKPWVGLTIMEIEWCFEDASGESIVAARNIEAKLREKNT